jgi:hypothetical protein
MRTSSPGQRDPSDSDSTLLDNVVIFPDGSVTWVAASALLPEVIPTVACEVVPEWHSPSTESLQMPQPPEICVVVPEFAPRRILKSAGRS